MNREQIDVSARVPVHLAIQSILGQYWKHSLGLFAVNALNGVLFYITLESCWSRTLLSFFGLHIVFLWACLNLPPRKFSYVEAGEIAWDLGLASDWLLVWFCAIVNFMLGGVLTMVWLSCIRKYVISNCFSSFESFASFVLGVLFFAASIRVYPRAISAECSLLLECDHVLREIALRSKSKGIVYEITCSKCLQLYCTPEPLFTRGLCKQCYAHERFVAKWWVGVAGFGILVWQSGLRQLATHLVHDPVLKFSVWVVLFFTSTILWFPLVRGRWQVLFYWPRVPMKASSADCGVVPAPRLLVDLNRIGFRNPRL